MVSNTKTFAGTLVLQLVNEGQLGLDDPVSTYQPEEWPGSGTRARLPDTR
jgi:CubicO group peptidase (beta-lactamase class C family)